MFMIYIYMCVCRERGERERERERERENANFQEKRCVKILKFIKPFSDKNLWPCHFGNQKKEEYVCEEKKIVLFYFLKRRSYIST